VVEGKIQTRRGGRDLLLTLILDLINEILVGLLGEPTALIHIEVDVVKVECHIAEGLKATCLGRDGTSASGRSRHQVNGVVERDVETYLVVLEGNEGQSKTRVTVEPELEGDIEDVGATVAGLETRCSSSVLPAHHLVKLHGSIKVCRQRLPEVKPFAIMTIDDLTADLYLDLLEKKVTQATLSTSSPVHAISNSGIGEGDLDIGLPNKVGVAVHNGNETLTICGGAREVDTHRLNGEVGVTLVENLPEGNVGIASDVGILGAVSNKLKKTTSHLYLYFGRINSTSRVSAVLCRDKVNETRQEV
jgi:hypothetical protein